MPSHFLDLRLRLVLIVMLLAAFGSVAFAQTNEVEGLRKNTPGVHAFRNARVVQSAGKIIDGATLVIRDGVIEAVGHVSIPPDARVWDMNGHTIYPGLIDAYSDYGMPKAPERRQGPGGGDNQPVKEPERRGANHWNTGMQADEDAAELFIPDGKAAEKLRSQGITAALVVPTKGIFRGMSALVNVGDGDPKAQVVRAQVAQHIVLGNSPDAEDYPSSLMGIIAFIRQTFYDAVWYKKAHDAYSKKPSLIRPETNNQLAAMEGAMSGRIPVIVDASDEKNHLRADKIAKEFSLKAIIRGSGSEYKRLDAIKATGRSILLPVNFPETPSVQTPEDALDVSLEQLRHWDEAPENPARLQSAGVRFALTTATLKDDGTFLKQVRTAVQRGLSKDAALAAMTMTPASLFGVDKILGSLDAGKTANFIITDGDLFEEKTEILDAWIDGMRYAVKSLPEIDPRGTWDIAIDTKATGDTVTLKITGELKSLSGTFTWKKSTKLSNLSLAGSQLNFSFSGDSLGKEGIIRASGTVTAKTIDGFGEWSDGSRFIWSAIRSAPFKEEPDTMKPKERVTASFLPVYPHGEFGRAKIPDQVDALLVKNATIWTSGPEGNIEGGDLLIQKGKIVQVGKNLKTPAGAAAIDATGKHVTPGLIDAHSHMAGDGGLNEAGEAVSAEVRIGDVLDPDDIDIYRALAGGLTAAHVLHGSANPIGGQSQLIKLRWGVLPDELKFEGAPPTIKFALGENVKQSNWGERYTTRYPQTRMGVDQLMRDEFRAALDYETATKEFEKDKTAIPPRRDLELDAILEILKGQRFVHCHSYRQDEILSTMRVAEDFGFRIRVFQHILEGYKVADIMAKHGAGGSSFSDWWAYKFEVYDAIPYNGALMHDQGVLVSFNSDSDELARRMNLEAAKAVKYGGVSETEALKFVTINPAKQLKVDNRVGSLEAGKDADFVLWNGSPLSTYSMCEQTWIDGRKYFDRSEDRAMNKEVQKQRAELIQKALSSKKGNSPEAAPKPKKRGDIYDHPYGATVLPEVQQ